MTSEHRERPRVRMVPGGRRAPRGRLRRRLSAAARLVGALALVGGLYTAFVPGVGQAEDTPKLSDQAVQGKALFDNSCIACHGRNAQGVQGRGPSLIGVGSAAVEFQVETGRMPASQQGAQIERKDPALTPEEAKKIGQYIQELGGGPQLPADIDGMVDRARNTPGSLAKGGELFRVNCSSCHAFSANGGALSSGKYAPSMVNSTNRDMYGAMLTGPQNMPVFGDNELTPGQKAEIIAYVQNLKTDRDPGGLGMGRYGPVPEMLVIFLVGIAGLVLATVWIAGKS
jgi:ubiquinol-cytochrome c reductase cytochrome c subunit